MRHTVKFSKAALLTAADEAIQEINDAIELKYQRDVAEYEEKQTTWIAAYRDHWLQALDTVRAKLEADEPIEQSDLPTERYGGVRLFWWDREPKRFESHEVQSIRNFRRAIELLADDEVSVYALEKLGLLNPMRKVVAHLRKQQAEKQQAEKK